MKVTPRIRKEIILACNSDELYKTIASRYGVTKSYVSHIARKAGVPKRESGVRDRLARMVQRQDRVFG